MKEGRVVISRYPRRMKKTYSGRRFGGAEAGILHSEGRRFNGVPREEAGGHILHYYP